MIEANNILSITNQITPHELLDAFNTTKTSNHAPEELDTPGKQSHVLIEPYNPRTLGRKNIVIMHKISILHPVRP